VDEVGIHAEGIHAESMIVKSCIFFDGVYTFWCLCGISVGTSTLSDRLGVWDLYSWMQGGVPWAALHTKNHRLLEAFISVLDMYSG
jgi:hypothetical protein